MACENVVLQEITGSVQNIGENRKRKSDGDDKITKFICLAEGMNEFEGNIRSFYRSQSQKIRGKNKTYSFHVTIPESPMLLSQTRTRPVNYPTAEDRAQKEIEEIESFQFKAKPVNKKIFGPPQLRQRFPRAPLVVEPFNLTEYKRKETNLNLNQPFQFKASQAHTNVPYIKSPDKTVPQPFSFEQKDKLIVIRKEEKD